METRANYVLLGVFTIAMFLAVIFFSLWISKAQFAESATYDIVFQGPISGLAKGGDVRFNGIKVGDVKSLRIDPEDAQRVVARVGIDAHTPVRTSSEAQLEGLGLTGVTLIQLTAGNAKDPLLKSGFAGPPPRIYAKPNALGDLMKTGEDVAAQAQAALVQINRVLTDENIKHLSNTIKNLDAASDALSKRDGALERVANAAKSITDLSDSAHAKLDHFGQRADKTFDAVDRAAGSAADSADAVADQAVPTVSAAARDLRRLSASLEQLSGEIEDGSSSLIPGAGRAKPTVKVNP